MGYRRSAELARLLWSTLVCFPMSEGSVPPNAVILVAEDNEVAREGLAVLLRRAGYQVIPAANGQEALDRLDADTRPDVILLDMLMPVLDGWHFLERLRQR